MTASSNSRTTGTSLPSAADASPTGSPTVSRRPYRKPELTAYGRVEDMTRAATKSGSEAGGKPRR
ncbi:MAG: hypothetical protein U0271_42395 [Polyangiaceae bacterium]